jgi:glycine betaine/proline transport system ATP-binding protein
VAGVIAFTHGEYPVTAVTEQRILTDFPCCLKSDYLYQIYDRCAQGLPIAVLDQDRRLCGVIDPRDVFLQLSPSDGSQRSRDQQTAHTSQA